VRIVGDMDMGGLTLADRAAEVRRWITTGQARELRLAAGLSQALVAQDCEVTPSAVHRWEMGGRMPRGRNVVAYHRFLAKLAERQVGGAGHAEWQDRAW
jgi:DNA-binding transcriptional regulator YiaG